VHSLNVPGLCYSVHSLNLRGLCYCVQSLNVPVLCYCVHSLNVPGLCFHIWTDNGSFEPKHVAEFLIFITIYIVLLTGIN